MIVTVTDCVLCYGKAIGIHKKQRVRWRKRNRLKKSDIFCHKVILLNNLQIRKVFPGGEMCDYWPINMDAMHMFCFDWWSGSSVFDLIAKHNNLWQFFFFTGKKTQRESTGHKILRSMPSDLINTESGVLHKVCTQSGLAGRFCRGAGKLCKQYWQYGLPAYDRASRAWLWDTVKPLWRKK